MNPTRIDFHTHWHHESYGRINGDPLLFLEQMDEAGISHAVVLPTAGLMHAGAISSDNDEIAAAASQSNGRIIGLGTVQPWNAAAAEEECRRCFAKPGMAGLKLHPWLQGGSVFAPGVQSACRVAAETGKFLFFHDGTPPFSLPSQIGLLAHQHPDVQFVLGHCGLMEFWREALEVLNACPNLWGCICGPHHAAAREIWRQGPQDRLLWGSDFGFGKSALIAYRLAEFRAWNLPPEAETALFASNPGRLLALNDG